MEPLDIELEEGELELPAEPMHLNMGPSHPAMHGTVRIVLELSGETIVKADVQIGYLHRGFEKMCERGTWAQVFPYVDRLNYVSPMLNNVGYALAVEKLCGLVVPDRCQWYRMALGELARISDHLTCTGAMAMELGAFTPFLWFVKAREMVWDILEEETGARLTHSFGRIGGMAQAAHAPTSRSMCARGAAAILALVEEGEKMLLKNRIFLDRLRERRADQRRGRASPSAWTGPCLRSTGVAYDIRKAHPYLKYDEVDFDVPVGTRGDTLDRFLVRLGGDPPEQAHHRAVRSTRMADDGPGQLRRPARRAPREDGRLHDHRGHDSALQADHGGRQGPRGRGLLVHRGRQRRARLLPRLRRHRHAVPRAHPPAVLPDHRRPAQPHRGPDAERHRADVRLAEHDRRRVRPLSSTDDFVSTPI